MRLEDEIRQSRPFDSLEQAAHLGIARTAALLEHALGEAMKPYGITPTQYNVLRILRGAGGEGLCRRDIIERMVRQVPDATRLLDRMEASGLIVRERSSADRRYVTTRLTAEGRALVDRLDAPVTELHRRYFGALGVAALETLIEVLGEVRGRIATATG